MKQCHYFVSYQYIDKNNKGFGQVNLLLKEKITNPEQIDELVKYLTTRFNYQSVVIINILLLKTEEALIAE
jgi:hypothetical protein